MEKSVSPSLLNATTNGHTPVKRGFRRQKTRTTKKSGHTGETFIQKESLIKEKPVSASDLTMLDWYAAFAILTFGNKIPYNELPLTCFNVAEAFLLERKKRV